MFNLPTHVVLNNLRTTGQVSTEAPDALTVPLAGSDRDGWLLPEYIGCLQLTIGSSRRYSFQERRG